MFEIYSEVRAILSPNVISAIKGCVLDTVNQCVFPANVEQVIAENEIQYHLCGTLDNILIAKSKLEELLNSLHINTLAKESTDLDSATLSEENSSLADESCDKEGTDKTSCLSDDKERETNASSNGYVSTNTESSVKTTLRVKPPSKKVRLVLKERPRISQRLRSARLAVQLRTLKKKSIVQNKQRPLHLNDPDCLSENLQQMKLVTEDSDADSTGTDAKSTSPARVPCKARNYEAVSAIKYSCELCSFKTKRSSHFLKHMAIHDKVGTIYKCSHCSFSSVRLSHLRRHEMIHSSTIHSCTDCHYKTHNIRCLLRHTKLKHCGFKENDSNSSLVLSCPHCSYQTTKQRYFDRHQRLHCNKRTFLHQCEECSYKTHRKEHYIRHMNSVHGKERPYLCHICGKAFKRGDALQQHHQMHSVGFLETTNYKCTVCDKQFRSQSHLCEHQAVHSEFRSFLCEICGASFKTRSVHRKHVQSIHRNPRAFSCDVCSKKFNTQYTLKRHKKTHSGKPNHIPPAASGTSDKSTSETHSDLASLTAFFPQPEAEGIPSTSVQPAIQTDRVDFLSALLPRVTVSGTDLLHPITPPVTHPTETAAILYLDNNVP